MNYSREPSDPPISDPRQEWPVEERESCPYCQTEEVWVGEDHPEQRHCRYGHTWFSLRSFQYKDEERAPGRLCYCQGRDDSGGSGGHAPGGVGCRHHERTALAWIYERAGRELWASRRRPDEAGHHCLYRAALQAVKARAKQSLARAATPGPDWFLPPKKTEAPLVERIDLFLGGEWDCSLESASALLREARDLLDRQ